MSTATDSLRFCLSTALATRSQVRVEGDLLVGMEELQSWGGGMEMFDDGERSYVLQSSEFRETRG